MKIILPFHNPEKFLLTQRFGEKFMYRNKMCKHKGVDYAISPTLFDLDNEWICVPGSPYDCEPETHDYVP